MGTLRFVIPTLLGIEGLTAKELKRLGMEQVQTENGRVFCQGTQRDLPRLNLNLRTVYRYLARFYESGLLSSVRGKITITQQQYQAIESYLSAK